jgi:hypothetical protein
MIECPVSRKCFVTCLLGEESQQPTLPHVNKGANEVINAYSSMRERGTRENKQAEKGNNCDAVEE